MSAPERFPGADSTGTVHVAVVPGGEVVEVRLEPNWRRTVGHGRLGAAVLAAIHAAGIAYTAGWADALAAVRNRPAPAARPVELPLGPVAIHNALTTLDELRRERRNRPVVDRTRLTRGTSAGGHVTVTLRGRRVVDVLVEPRWNGNHLEVAGELRSAFAAAYAELPALPTPTAKHTEVPGTDLAADIAALFAPRH